MFVVEPTASAEKLRELLREGHESSALDYKSTVDLDVSDEVVELTKDLAAMRGEPLGGYVVVGADNHGAATDGLADPRLAGLFDEATLRAKVQKYLTEPFTLHSGVHEVDGHVYALIYIGPAERGFEIIRVEGSSKGRVVFRPGDVFVRRGTASVRWNAADADERLGRYADSRRETWRREMREDLREILSAGEAGQRISRGPVNAFTWQLDAETFEAAAIELLRANDDITLRRFLLRSPGEVARLRSDQRVDDAGVVLDRLAAVAALAIELERPGWVAAVVDSLMRIYELGADASGADQPNDRDNVTLWLALLTRVYGVGALAVRLRAWWAIPLLATAKPNTRDFDSYWQSWLRHAQVQASRAAILDNQSGVIARARNDVRRLAVLRPDVGEDDERVLTSLCQFDLLAAVAVSAARHMVTPSSYYPNFAPYSTTRTSPAFAALVRDPHVRDAVAGDLSDRDLAIVLEVIAATAVREGFTFGGFMGVDAAEVRAFIEENLPADFDSERREQRLDGTGTAD